MSEQTIFGIGKLLTGSEDKDAIHFAVAPVEAAERLYPGQHIGYEDGYATTKQPHIGIVDPFLAHPVLSGERCWMMLYPNTITALRHNWTHPSFPAKKTVGISDSEKWLRDYAERAGFGYERVLESARRFVVNGGDMNDRLRYDSDLEDFMWEEKEEFWKHFQAVTGQAVPDDLKDRHIFWCSC